MALMAIGEAAVHVPDPFNLWMNIPVSPQGRISWEAPVSPPVTASSCVPRQISSR